jgi:preprotein translocase subunit SecB
MIAKKSPLVLDTFFVVENRFKFTQPEEEIEDVPTQLFNDYEIDLDFTIRPVSGESDSVIKFNVYTKMGVNQLKIPKSGYSSFVEGIGAFTISKENLTDMDVDNLMNLSSVSIMINCLRGVLMDISSNAPLGRFILPMIDINDLLSQKLSKGKRKLRKKAIEE